MPKKPASPGYRKRASGDGHIMHVYLAKEGEEQAIHDMLLKAKAIYGTPTSMVIKLALRRFLPYFLSGEYQQRENAKTSAPANHDYDAAEQRIMEAAEAGFRKVLAEQAAPAGKGKKGS